MSAERTRSMDFIAKTVHKHLSVPFKRNFFPDRNSLVTCLHKDHLYIHFPILKLGFVKHCDSLGGHIQIIVAGGYAAE